MKRLLKNKKGFTLVELLAVIVVLAIIMVIATTQINNVIKKSRGDSFVSSYKLVLDTVKKCELMSMDDTECKGSIDLSDDYSLDLSSENGTYSIKLSAATGGKFANMDLTTNYQPANGTANNKEKLANATKVNATSIEATYSASGTTTTKTGE